MRRMRARWSCRVERCRALLYVVRVHDEGFGELSRRPGELAQHENAGVVVARSHELLRDQIHPVVQAAHEADL